AARTDGGPRRRRRVTADRAVDHAGGSGAHDRSLRRAGDARVRRRRGAVVTAGAAAGRYARALFDVVLKEGGDFEQVQADLQQFVDLFAQHPVLGATLGNPAIPASKKAAVARALVERAGTIGPVVGKLILLLAERDRVM